MTLKSPLLIVLILFSLNASANIDGFYFPVVFTDWVPYFLRLERAERHAQMTADEIHAINARADELARERFGEEDECCVPGAEEEDEEIPPARSNPHQVPARSDAGKERFYKTQLCKRYMTYGECANGKDCTYAHGKKQLRKDPLFKTKLCQSFRETGKCEKRDNCGFAHGKDELRKRG
jgi:hypothetical protein